ncbi:6-phosphofructo-2-kinase/fructose-2,6-bisphosphatase 2 [Balamuthia mandrillaris]
MRLFLKYGSEVKKQELDAPPTSLLAIRKLFAQRFKEKRNLQEEAGNSSPSPSPSPSSSLNNSAASATAVNSSGAAFTPSPIYIQHREAKIWYHLEDLQDLYNNAILEMRKDGKPYSDDDEIARRPDNHMLGIPGQKLIFVMVGLPARGKTYIARKIARYCNWLGVPTQVFNVGSYRRNRLGAYQPPEFFDPSNMEGRTARLHMAVLALDDMFDWLQKGGRIGIYDATNNSRERRELIVSRCNDENVQAIFIESICEDPVVIESNLRETKLRSPDFEHVAPEEAMKQFLKRIDFYAKSYQPISEEENISFIKLYDVGRKIMVNNLPTGYLPSRIVFFLMNLHIVPRPIWLTRHGESEDNAAGLIGGDSRLTPLGEKYAQALATFFSKRVAGYDLWNEGDVPTPTTTDVEKQKGESNTNNNTKVQKKKPLKLTVWTSTLERAISTSQYIPNRKVHLRCLDEIDAGKCDGMTYEEIAEKMPDQFAARAADKLRYRYPQGESYQDVIQRLEPVIFELERQRDPVLVIAHNAVIRCLYGYFNEKMPEDCPHIDIPLHTLIELTPRAYGSEETRYPLLKLMNIPAPIKTAEEGEGEKQIKKEEEGN